MYNFDEYYLKFNYFMNLLFFQKKNRYSLWPNFYRFYHNSFLNYFNNKKQLTKFTVFPQILT